jgi:mannitol/fructose-specific phosphotransferase system IIA component (Ntr-type)
VAFDAPDGRPAHVVFLLVTPDAAVQVDFSAEIAHLFREPRCLERVLRAASFTQLLAALRTAAE